MHQNQRPPNPPVTAPQKSSGVPPFFARPKNPPSSAPMTVENSLIGFPEELSISVGLARLQAELVGVSSSDYDKIDSRQFKFRIQYMTFAQSLEVLWTILREVPLADYSKAISIYEYQRLHSKYSILDLDASDADRWQECHRQALSIAIQAIKEPSPKKYSTDAPPVFSSFPRGYSFSLRTPPEPSIRQPTPPARFVKRASPDDLEDQMSLEISWNNAFRFNDLPGLEFLARQFDRLYAPYQPKDFQPPMAPLASVGEVVSYETPAISRVLAVSTACAAGSCAPLLPPSADTIAASFREARAPSDVSDSSYASDASSLPVCLDPLLKSVAGGGSGVALPASRNVAACPSPSGMDSQGSSFSGSLDGLTPFRGHFADAGCSPAVSRARESSHG